MSAPRVGDELPPFDVPSVDDRRMKTMAAILRDPYPVHWDRSKVAALGLGERVINQGPLNLSYIANMLMAWAGDESVRRLTVSFGRPVLDGDHVVAHGVVDRVDDDPDVDGGWIATCTVWLARGDEHVVDGTAVVAGR